MMKRKFCVTVSAMILAVQLGSPLAAAEPTVEELSQIAAFLESNDVEALRAYILLRPELLEGDTPLAGLLREFMEESVNVAEYLGFEPNLRDTVAQSITRLDPEDCVVGEDCPPNPVFGTPPPDILPEPAVPSEPDLPPEAEVPPGPDVPPGGDGPDAPEPPITRNPPVLGQAPEPVDTIY